MRFYEEWIQIKTQTKSNPLCADLERGGGGGGGGDVVRRVQTFMQILNFFKFTL